MAVMTDQTYDYVIVGAGAAGCVLAYRLTADRRNRVLLVEGGGSDRNPFIHMPKGIGKALSAPGLVWPYATTPHPCTNNNAEIWARGKVLGGSSAVNGMMYVRGQGADYDAVATTTSEDWSWSRIGQAYREMENHELGAAETRGATGPLHITMPDQRDDLSEAAIDACVMLGMSRKVDVNEPTDDERCGWAPRTVYKGVRESAARAFLKPARRRPNLTVLTGFMADKVVIEGKRAVGISGSHKGVPVTYRAAREVLLCAGALASPAMLQRSGIGPAERLHQIGVPLVQESPELGYNLREHRALVMQWRTDDDASQNKEYRGSRLVKNVAEYYLTRKGKMSSATYEVGAWFKTRPDLDRPDAQYLIAPYTMDFAAGGMDVEKQGGMHICAYILRPESTGTVMARSASPADLPEIVPNYHMHHGDRQKMIDLMHHARRLVRTEPLGRYIKEETRPSADFQSDDQIIAAYDAMGNGAYHASGSAEMGKDGAKPLDPRLRVRGIDGLRVCDTSILPFLVAGNTNGPAMVMAWRAADMILEENA